MAPGSVSPFGLINDADHSVRVVIDRDLRSAVLISFHPNINTATVVLSCADFQRFLELLDCSALHLAMRWLGWSAEWTPPAEHRRDWLDEALRATARIQKRGTVM